MPFATANESYHPAPMPPGSPCWQCGGALIARGETLACGSCGAPQQDAAGREVRPAPRAPTPQERHEKQVRGLEDEVRRLKLDNARLAAELAEARAAQAAKKKREG